MATIRRAGFGSVFEVENETVGIGTTGTATNTLQVLENIKSSDATVIGLSTLTTYQGFVDKQAKFGRAVIDVEFQAGTLGEVIIESDVTVSSASTLTSSVNQLTLTDSFSLPTGNTDSRIHCQTAGSMRFNEDLGTLEFYTGDMWKTVNSYKDVGNRGRGFWIGGFGPTSSGRSRTIDYVNIQSLGNAIKFGELLTTTVGTGNEGSMSCGNEIRGVIGGGNGPSDTCPYIQYITTASEGDAINFGDLSQTRFRGSGLANSTRGLFCGGRNPGSFNTVDYVQIMTLGTALDFGDLLHVQRMPGTCSSSTRGLINGGQGGTAISAVTIASKGDATEFGQDLFSGGYTHGGGSTGVRGMWAGGYAAPSGSPYPLFFHTRSIRGVTIASDGNSQEFGELKRINGLTYLGGLSDRTRACWGGGYVLAPAIQVNTIEYFQMNSTGNARDFGDLTVTRSILSSLSDSHGGLGGI